MEALADFGTVDLLGVQALTSAIYRVWNGAFDEAAALQLATVLLRPHASCCSPSSGCCAGGPATTRRSARATRSSPGRSAAGGAGSRASPGWVLLAGRVRAAGRAARRLVGRRPSPTARVAPSLGKAARNTALLGGDHGASSRSPSATVLVFGSAPRARASARGVTRLVDARLRGAGHGRRGRGLRAAGLDRPPARRRGRRRVTGSTIGLVFTGTILGLVFAYLVRFNALAFLAVESRMNRIDPNLDDAARALGADRARVLADVHLPLLWPGMLAGALLVLVEVMKELPATALLRPLGGDTLAITVWEATKDSRFDAAALPALLIVLVGLLPVIVLVRLLAVGGLELGRRAPLTAALGRRSRLAATSVGPLP